MDTWQRVEGFVVDPESIGVLINLGNLEDFLVLISFDIINTSGTKENIIFEPIILK